MQRQFAYAQLLDNEGDGALLATTICIPNLVFAATPRMAAIKSSLVVGSPVIHVHSPFAASSRSC
jgi:hypothetical protein